VSERGTTRPGHLRLLSERPDSAERIAIDQAAPFRAARAETSISVLIAAGQALVRASYGALLERHERIVTLAAPTDQDPASR
jgi:hypothetical protein